MFNKEKLSFVWMKEFAKIGGISGTESFVRNIAYILMVSREECLCEASNDFSQLATKT